MNRIDKEVRNMEARTNQYAAAGTVTNKAVKTEKSKVSEMGFVGSILMAVSCFLDYGIATIKQTGKSGGTEGFTLKQLNKMQAESSDEKFVKNIATYFIIIAVVGLVLSLADQGVGLLIGGIVGAILQFKISGIIFSESSGSYQFYSILDRVNWEMSKGIGYYLMFVAIGLLIIGGLASIGEKENNK